MDRSQRTHRESTVFGTVYHVRWDRDAIAAGSEHNESIRVEWQTRR